VVFTEAAERLQIQMVIVEKDYWVFWMLGQLFGRRFACAGGSLEIAILCPKFGAAENLPARAASGTHGQVGTGLS
jgi:hypothetical protein